MLAKTDPAVIREKVERAAKILNLTPYLQRTPKELSGGQRQRVAIGRAIVRSPKVFLFDEPLSNLDAALRGQTRVEIAKLHRELNATTIYVTHDQVEAMTLAHRVVVLRDGQIEQVGTPLDLYYRPNNQFVAQFIGTPQMNMVAGPDMAQFEGSLSMPVPSGGYLGLRPESLTLSAPGSGQVQGAGRAGRGAGRRDARLCNHPARHSARCAPEQRPQPAARRRFGRAADRRRGRPSVRLARTRRSALGALIPASRNVHVGPARDAPSGARLLPSRAPGAVPASAHRIGRQRLGAGRRQHPAGHDGADGEPRGPGRRLHAGDGHAGRGAKLHQDHGDQDRRAVRAEPGRSDRHRRRCRRRASSPSP